MAIYSGVRPRKHLEEHEIEVIHDLPGVGSDLVCAISLFVRSAERSSG